MTESNLPTEESSKPLIVQSDKSLLLDVSNPLSDQCRIDISSFAELEKSPEHIHTYKVTPLGLWNASAAGFKAEQVTDTLVRWSKYAIPQSILIDIKETMERYGRLKLITDEIHGLVLATDDPIILTEVINSKSTQLMLGDKIDDYKIIVIPQERGRLKQALIKLGWPAEDMAGYTNGDKLEISLKDEEEFKLRPYQIHAADSFNASGNGVIVMPCGSGKTLVGLSCMAKSSMKTLILVTNTVSARQWKHEILKHTNLKEEDVGEYSGEKKLIAPVTIATYQILIKRLKGSYTHLSKISEEGWGLIIYDEVHLLPAPVFRMAADIQSRRRLGLTATLIREDGKESDVFSLIGPKRYDAPWRDIEAQGWIAPAQCTEIRVTLKDEERMKYALSEPDERYRAGSTAQSKIQVVEAICNRAKEDGELTLVIGQFIDQIEYIAQRLNAPLITGKTANKVREQIYEDFRQGNIPVLVVSKVANFSIDLPEASVAIQVSGTFGSRQEEAQRLGRVLRPKKDGRQAHFYTVVARDTVDQSFAAKRQRFLAEQGYAYSIVDADAIIFEDIKRAFDKSS